LRTCLIDVSVAACAEVVRVVVVAGIEVISRIVVRARVVVVGAVVIASRRAPIIVYYPSVWRCQQKWCLP
jgi:hypothetical protein